MLLCILKKKSQKFIRGHEDISKNHFARILENTSLNSLYIQYILQTFFNVEGFRQYCRHDGNIPRVDENRPRRL
jgi:hypothetical protein